MPATNEPGPVNAAQGPSARETMWAQLIDALGHLDPVYRKLEEVPQGESGTLTPGEIAICRACIAAVISECQTRKNEDTDAQRDEGRLPDDGKTHVLVDFVVDTRIVPTAILNEVSDLDVLHLVRTAPPAVLQNANWSVLRPRGFVPPAQCKRLPPNIIVPSHLANAAGAAPKIEV